MKRFPYWPEAVVLALFWVVLVAATRQKSLTADEIVHAPAGYSYWRFDDYRLNPENGNLPQRWFGGALVAAGYDFPSRETAAWQRGDEWAIGDAWFHEMGYRIETMLLLGRGAAALLAVALAALVAWRARLLFGEAGGRLA